VTAGDTIMKTIINDLRMLRFDSGGGSKISCRPICEPEKISGGV